MPRKKGNDNRAKKAQKEKSYQQVLLRNRIEYRMQKIREAGGRPPRWTRENNNASFVSKLDNQLLRIRKKGSKNRKPKGK